MLVGLLLEADQQRKLRELTCFVERQQLIGCEAGSIDQDEVSVWLELPLLCKFGLQVLSFE